MTTAFRLFAAVPFALSLLAPHAASAAPKSEKLWTDRFDLSSCVWSSTGRNDYFILEPGDVAIFDGREDGKSVHLEVTVLDEVKRVDGVETRVVEEKETHGGQLAEISRNYFAVCGPSSDVFYFGEDVDTYKDGKVVDHESSWLAGVAGARAGLFMPARPLLGARFYQELAPGVAMDRIEIVSDSVSLKTPAGEFHECLKTEETTPVEPGAVDHKIFARGIGMIQDGSLPLTRHQPAPKKP